MVREVAAVPYYRFVDRKLERGMDLTDQQKTNSWIKNQNNDGLTTSRETFKSDMMLVVWHLYRPIWAFSRLTYSPSSHKVNANTVQTVHTDIFTDVWRHATEVAESRHLQFASRNFISEDIYTVVSSRRKINVQSCWNCAMIDTTILLQVFNKDSKIPLSFV